ncbi:MAG: hypothetical protein M3Q73_02070 [bacterium]|nr:hypothetical protein [bacterium]
MFKKSPLKKTRLHKKKRRKLLLKIAGVFLILIALVVGISWLSRLKMLNLSSIQVEGNAAVSAEEIEVIAQRHLEGMFYYLFPRSNKFFYNKDDILQDIITTIPRVKEVELSGKGQTLVISILERAPAYTWCTGTPKKTKEDCYFIDNDGFIFSKAPTFSGNAYVAFYGLVQGETPIGSSYLDKKTFLNLDGIIEFFKEKQIPTYALLASSNGNFELYFEQGGKLIFKNTQASTTVTSNVDLFMRDTKILSAAQLPLLDYLDVRFGNKLYVKLKGDNPLQLQSESGV